MPWQPATTLTRNMHGRAAQVARYSGPRGILYAWTGNYLYSWAIRMDGADFAVSRAFAHNSRHPCVVAVR